MASRIKRPFTSDKWPNAWNTNRAEIKHPCQNTYTLYKYFKLGSLLSYQRDSSSNIFQQLETRTKISKLHTDEMTWTQWHRFNKFNNMSTAHIKVCVHIHTFVYTSVSISFYTKFAFLWDSVGLPFGSRLPLKQQAIQLGPAPARRAETHYCSWPHDCPFPLV